jgi:uncharacterized protein (TIGR03437 family)
MTFTVVPGTITCSSLVASELQCSAHASFSADIGGSHWSYQYLNTPVGAVAFVVDSIGAISSTGISLAGSAFQSSSLTASGILAGGFTLGYSGNLLASDTLPSGIPSPAAVAASPSSILVFLADQGSATARISYTGQNCASGSSTPLAPSITSNGIVPIYSSSTTIQPGSWVSIFGNNLATSTATWNGDFPTSLGNTTVTINNKPAYLWYVSPTQINLQTPDDTATGTVSVTVTTPAGSVTSTATLGQFGPSFSLLDGKHVAGIILRSDGSGAYGGGTYDIVGPTGTSLGYKTVAAKAGDTLELFGGGFGSTNPAVPAGKVYSGAAATTNPVGLSINNVTVTPLFAGITLAGLYQINLKLPSGLGTGDVPLQAVVGSVQTPSGVVLSVQ